MASSEIPGEQPFDADVGTLDVSAVRAVLRESGHPASSIEPVGSGQVSWTYLVDEQWIVRVPRYATAIEPMRVQAELMSLVGESVSFRVPRPEWIGEYAGRPVQRYRKVPGRALEPADHWREVAGMLRESHRVPANRAAEILGQEASIDAWRASQLEFRELLEQALLPRLDAELGREVAEEYDRFLTQPVDFAPTFVHSDLAAEHVLVDPDTRVPIGFIDFDWASVGDPSIDLAGMLDALGPETTQELAAACGDVSWKRLLFYWWLNPCYPLVYAGDYLGADVVRQEIEELRSRLAALNELR